MNNQRQGRRRVFLGRSFITRGIEINYRLIAACCRVKRAAFVPTNKTVSSRNKRLWPSIDNTSLRSLKIAKNLPAADLRLAGLQLLFYFLIKLPVNFRIDS
jgi:hypothetical protein